MIAYYFIPRLSCALAKMQERKQIQYDPNITAIVDPKVEVFDKLCRAANCAVASDA